MHNRFHHEWIVARDSLQKISCKGMKFRANERNKACFNCQEQPKLSKFRANERNKACFNDEEQRHRR